MYEGSYATYPEVRREQKVRAQIGLDSTRLIIPSNNIVFCPKEMFLSHITPRKCIGQKRSWNKWSMKEVWETARIAWQNVTLPCKHYMNTSIYLPKVRKVYTSKCLWSRPCRSSLQSCSVITRYRTHDDLFDCLFVCLCIHFTFIQQSIYPIHMLTIISYCISNNKHQFFPM